ncbi:hypothetical protein, partial [Amycolatopsis sp. NPDC051102]|uniref:ParB/RepB/Spo0J family partition protein n=1 Tax=Amycolatopsis sp. NPDC051102 TaxID=3155163 RepID=UPI0034434101
MTASQLQEAIVIPFAEPDPAAEEKAASRTEEPAPMAQDSDPAADTSALVTRLLDPTTVAPHPFNSVIRSQPDWSEPRWAKLRASVAERGGNTAAGTVVTIAAFLQARPTLADKFSEKIEYVAICGHRRRATTEATETPFKAEVDDSLMENNGDIVRMTEDNHNHEDISELEEALMFENYIRAGVSQRSLAKLLTGYTQPTISRRLALLNLCPELIEAINGQSPLYYEEVEEGDKKIKKLKKLPTAEAAVIAQKFPFADPSGPAAKKGATLDEGRRRAQIQVLKTMNARGRETGWNTERVCLYVAQVIESVTTAEKQKIKLIKPGKEFGFEAAERRLTDAAGITKARKAGTLAAEVDTTTGELVYYTTAEKKKPEPTTPQAKSASPAAAPKTKAEPSEYELARKAEEANKTEARKNRMESLLKIVGKTPAQKDILWMFARSYHNGIAQTAGGGDAGRVAQKLWFEGNLEPTLGDQFREQMEANEDPKLDLRGAWARMLASYELHARNWSGTWNRVDIEYFDLLYRLDNYTPTAWESEQLSKTRQRLADQEAADEPDADEADDADDADEADEPDADEADDADDA